MVPRDPLERTLHSATLRPLGEATAYAGSLTPALRGIDLPGRGRGSSEGTRCPESKGNSHQSDIVGCVGQRVREDAGEDPPRIRGRTLRGDGKETTGESATDQGEDQRIGEKTG